MGVPNVFVGGTGAVAAEVNENFDFVTMHRKKFTDATERTNAAGLTDTATTFTLTAPVGALIIGVRVKADLRNDAGDNVKMTLKFTGGTLGTTFLSNHRQWIDDGVPNFGATQLVAYSAAFDTTEGTDVGLLGNTIGTGYDTLLASFGMYLEIEDVSTTITVRLGGDSGNNFIRNVEVDIIYIPGFTED